MSQPTATLFKTVFDQSQTILIVYPPDALRDHLLAATALYKTIQVQTDKKVQLLAPRSLAEYEPDIAYLSETKTDVGHKNLCIAFDHNENAVDKVSYHVDEVNKKFYLTIKPKEGSAPLSHEAIEFSYIGADADMVILVGVDDLLALEQVYVGYENLYQNTALISINSYETTFGSMKIDTTGYSSTSEYVATLLNDLQLAIDAESATNLLAGIDEETAALTTITATPNTFEMVAQLLRNGGKRFARNSQAYMQADVQQLEPYVEEPAEVQAEVVQPIAPEVAPAPAQVVAGPSGAESAPQPVAAQDQQAQQQAAEAAAQATEAQQRKKQKNKVRNSGKK